MQHVTKLHRGRVSPPPGLQQQGEPCMRKHLTTIILILLLLTGLSFLLYPTVSDWWNSLHQSRAIAGYTEAVEGLDGESYEKWWEGARGYNEGLKYKPDRYRMTEGEKAEYEAQLNVAGNGIMGYIEIPGIKCSLPIYHGTDEAVLQVAVGHVSGSSLPVGGEGSHCVLSGHRGLPSAKLFTDLDQMGEGDLFMLHVLDETLAYEVDQITVVLPEEVNGLELVEGEDYCTLVTCTPYGINTHRLLVRGKRTENLSEEKPETVGDGAGKAGEEPPWPPYLWAVPILAAKMIGAVIHRGKKRGK